ncbi:MAG: hypothetical protein PHH22_02715 [Clostridia bacterium]|nr:hypothetical protein [Clostridia bacterium]
MVNEIELDQIKRIVIRIKTAIQIKNEIKKSDIHTWINIYAAIINDIISIEGNECSIYDGSIMTALYETIKKDPEILFEDFEYFCNKVNAKKNSPGGNCSG